ncbi:ABC transporter permease [Streptococcus lutetiensis]|mgnify:FL=1|uniref:ABC transporter permease n=1 Tax=Streptococcus lutetiensis TaxID=150055 RepID=UPI00117FDA9B|nr:ABC transporter permease [Streptococcus lutetiensis]MBT0891599.1 ABC transporter permease [Streptococcus lutetiensis]MBT0902768.1 ABC transporter permease [Streptococcus lutetiensis]MBT0943111.1 ABC transporter permease [Streptococcus lutetiensis]MBT0947709.1 ABC transporter permease [Streptococcus lutetiensis]
MKFIILRNNLQRFLKEKSYVIISFLLVFVTIAATSFVVTMESQKVKIGVTKNAIELLEMNSNNISVKEVERDEDYYVNLILGKYDAYINKEDGKYKVTTVRNSTLGKKLSQYVNKGKSLTTSTSNSNNHYKIIITVMAMSSMILSLILYRFYFDDRNGLDKRIYLSGVSNFSYVLQQVMFNFLILFITNLLSGLILLPLFDLDISWKLVLYILLIELFSANFGMVLSTLTKKNQGALLIGTMVSVLTMLLSGALFSVKKGSIQDKIHYIFPQYYISNLGKNIDGNSTNLTHSITVIVGYTLLFFLIANYLQNRKVGE